MDRNSSDKRRFVTQSNRTITRDFRLHLHYIHVYMCISINTHVFYHRIGGDFGASSYGRQFNDCARGGDEDGKK